MSQNVVNNEMSHNLNINQLVNKSINPDRQILSQKMIIAYKREEINSLHRVILHEKNEWLYWLWDIAQQYILDNDVFKDGLNPNSLVEYVTYNHKYGSGYHVLRVNNAYELLYWAFNKCPELIPDRFFIFASFSYSLNGCNQWGTGLIEKATKKIIAPKNICTGHVFNRQHKLIGCVAVGKKIGAFLYDGKGEK